MSARRATARRGDLTPLSSRFPGRRHARRIPRFAFAVLLVFGLAWAVAALAQDSTGTPADPGIPKAVGFVNDHAGKLDEPTRARLEAFLDQVKRKTGAEFAVLIMPSIAPWDASDYKVRVFQQWGLGRKGKDDGLLMLVAIEEREVRFETGYGLEGILPDGLQSRIFREEMVPRLREGDWAGGITAGVLACATRIAADQGVTLEWDGRELRYRPERSGSSRELALLFVVAFVIIMIIVARSAGGPPTGRRRRGGWMIGPGGFGGFGGGSFGGFGGGGGGFGGGSFGGFGGGASGGGGGGGRF